MIGATDRTSHYIAVSIEVLGDGMNDQVDSQGGRLLKDRRGMAVVDHGNDAVLLGKVSTGRQILQFVSERVRRLEIYDPRLGPDGRADVFDVCSVDVRGRDTKSREIIG